jgi:hypothetical protein
MNIKPLAKLMCLKRKLSSSHSLPTVARRLRAVARDGGKVALHLLLPACCSAELSLHLAQVHNTL